MEKYIIISITGSIIIYLLFGFINWQLNAGMWDMETRIIVSVLIVGWLFLSAVIVEAIKKLNK